MTAIGLGIIITAFLGIAFGIKHLRDLYQEERHPAFNNMINKIKGFLIDAMYWLIIGIAFLGALNYLMQFMQVLVALSSSLLEKFSECSGSGHPLFWPLVIIAVLIVHAKNEIVRAIQERE